MDSFDKLIVDKVNQTQLPDADQAWNDFVKYRNRHGVAPKQSSRLFSKLSLGIIALLLLFIGALGGYEFARQEHQPVISKAETLAISKVQPRESNVKNNAGTTANIALIDGESTVDASPKAIRSSVSVPMAEALKDKSTPKTVVATTPSVSSPTDVLSIPAEPLVNSASPVVTVANDGAFAMNASAEAMAVTQGSQKQLYDQPVVNQPESSSEVESMKKQDSEESLLAKTESSYGMDNPVKESLNVSKSTVPPSYSGYYNTGSYADKGSVRKGKRIKMKEYLSVFNRYTDMSFYSLENTNDITTEMNASFMVNPANSGIENRYSLIGGAQGDFIQTPQKSLDLQSRGMYLGTSFAVANNKVGIGLAVRNEIRPSFSTLHFVMSTAYRITLAKNSQLRLGFGVNSSALHVDESEKPAMESSVLSFNLGARYMFKTLFAQISVNNVVPVDLRGNSISKSYIPATAQMSLGGRLFLSKSWAFHPQLTMKASENDDFRVGVTSGFSYRNRFLMGLQTDDFKSIGIHAGLYAGKHFTVIMKTDVYHCSESQSSILESGELMLKLELGRAKR